jgi:hypothetical protein
MTTTFSSRQVIPGQGMTHGTIAGMLLSDLIQGRRNKWEDLYSPSRIRLRALPEFASENINVATQYTDYVTAGDIKSESDLKPGRARSCARRLEDRGLPRRKRTDTQAFSRVPAPWMYRWLELDRTDMGLSVSRFEI